MSEDDLFMIGLAVVPVTLLLTFVARKTRKNQGAVHVVTKTLSVPGWIIVGILTALLLFMLIFWLTFVVPKSR